MSIFSATNALNAIKGSIIELLQMFHIDPNDISQIERQWKTITLVQQDNVKTLKNSVQKFKCM